MSYIDWLATFQKYNIMHIVSKLAFSLNVKQKNTNRSKNHQKLQYEYSDNPTL